MNWFVIIIHLLGIIVVTLLPIFTWNPTALFVILLILITTSMQWLILKQCIFSPFENGRKESVFVIWLQNMTNLSYDVVGKFWVFFLNYLPALLCSIKLYMIAKGCDNSASYFKAQDCK